MKPEELRKLSTEKLENMLKNIKFEQVRTSSVWGRDNFDNKKAGLKIKAGAKPGQKTSIQRDLRKVVARIKTILNERKIN